MDKTPVFFDMVPEKSLVQKSYKSVTIQASGSEKRHVTVALTVATDGFILPPMITFRGKTNQTIKEIEVWMFIWFDQVWKSYAEKNPKGIGFQQIVNGI